VVELSPTEARYADKALETQTALWSALIAAESFLLALAPLLALTAPQEVQPFAAYVCAMSLVSVGLLIWNFISTRELFLKVGRTLSETRAPSSADVPNAVRVHRQVRLRELLAVLLLVGQFVLILIAVFNMGVGKRGA
jgi:Na+/melibiose symporter-like transporter